MRAERGAKALGRREALTDRLADHLLARGLDAAGLRAMAQAAGTSDRMLLYYFEDKADLLGAVLDRLSERMAAALEAARVPDPRPLEEVRRRVAEHVLGDALWPYMRLWLEIAARAGRGEAPYPALAHAIGRRFLDWGAAQVEGGEAEAARLLLAVEGAALLKAVGLEETARAGL